MKTDKHCMYSDKHWMYTSKHWTKTDNHGMYANKPLINTEWNNECTNHDIQEMYPHT